MDAHIAAFADRHGGIFTRRVAIAAGYSDPGIHAAVVHRRWHRIRRGVYCDAAWWAGLSARDRHVARARAVAVRCGDDVVFTHVSGAVIRGWPIWGIPLEDVWVTRAKGHSGRHEAGVHHLSATLPPDQAEVVSDLRVASKERLMVDHARHYGFEKAVVVCDAALNAGADKELARRLFLETYYWPKARGAVAAIDFADGRAESPGESRLRAQLALRGFDGLRPQQELYGIDGRLLGRADLGDSEARVVVEFDGKVKYGIDGKDPRQQLWEEKRREDAIRAELGFEVVRVIWADLSSPAELAARVRAAYERARRRHARSAC